MSGTSLDGCDIALIEISDERQIRCLQFETQTYPAELRDHLHQFNLQPTLPLQLFATLEKQLGVYYADQVNHFLQKHHLQSQSICAIGSHGQTLYHDGNTFSIQIGHPAFIAKQTGITTVGDFRIDDMANEGQGAPLAPAFHRQLFHNGQAKVAVINLGGIANISLLSNDETLGFDTGPANSLMDEICQSQLNRPYDMDGKIAASAPVDNVLLQQMLTDPYFAKHAPKSTGRDYFNLNWLKQFDTEGTQTEVLISTLNQLTVETLAKAIEDLKADKIILSGGGAENPVLKQRLAKKVNLSVASSWDYDIDPNAIEAMMMGWLAHQRLTEQAIPLTSITGARKPSILGGVWMP